MRGGGTGCGCQGQGAVGNAARENTTALSYLGIVGDRGLRTIWPTAVVSSSSVSPLALTVFRRISGGDRTGPRPRTRTGFVGYPRSPRDGPRPRSSCRRTVSAGPEGSSGGRSHRARGHPEDRMAGPGGRRRPRRRRRRRTSLSSISRGSYLAQAVVLAPAEGAPRTQCTLHSTRRNPDMVWRSRLRDVEAHGERGPSGCPSRCARSRHHRRPKTGLPRPSSRSSTGPSRGAAPQGLGSSWSLRRTPLSITPTSPSPSLLEAQTSCCGQLPGSRSPSDG